MKKCKKGIIKFKSKVRKKLKDERRELKVRKEYADRLNKENNSLIELNIQNTKNMQATINQKDKEIRELKQELKATKEERVLILYEIEQERHNIVDLEKENSKLVVEKYDLETALSICNNRIKYEFRGE